MAKGHRSQIKRERNAQKDSRGFYVTAEFDEPEVDMTK